MSVVSIALFASAPGASASGVDGCAGDHVVVLDARVNSQANAPDPQSVSGTFSAPVPAGVYDIRVVTFDAYPGRESVTQASEQVVVTLGAVTFGPTTDLPDAEASAIIATTGQVELATALDGVVVSHVLSGTPDQQSLGVACVVLDATAGSPSPPSPPPPPPPPPPGPVPVPTCVGDHVVNLGLALDSRAGDPTPESRRASFGAPVPPGIYDITVVTYDGYPGRTEVTQLNEQVVVALGDAFFGPTTDLADAQAQATATTTGQVELTTEIDEIVVRHLLSGTATHNSVGVACVSLLAVEPPPPPLPPPPPVDDVELTLGFTCAPNSGVVVEILNFGGPKTGTVTVDGVPTEIAIRIDFPTTIVIPAPPGIRRVVVEISGTVVAEGDVDVGCAGAPGEEVPGGPGSGEEEPGGEGEVPGSGDPVTGGETPGSGGGQPPAPGPAPAPAPVVSPLGFLPELTVRVACADRTIEALVGNVGDETGSVTLAVAPSARSVLAEVAPASTTTVALPLPSDAEGTRTEVVVVTEAGEVLTGFADVDCLSPAAPVAEVVVDCAAGTAAVLIENAGGETVAVRAFAEQVAVLGTAELAAGEQVRYEVELTGPTIPLRVVAAGGTDILREEIEHTCRQVDVEPAISLVCPGDTLELTLHNDAADLRWVVVESDGASELVELDGGEDVMLVRSLAETGAVLVTSAFGDVLLDESLEGWGCDPELGTAPCGSVAPSDPRWVATADADLVPCPGLQGRLIVDCASGEGVVEIDNGSDDPAAVAVRRDGTLVDEPVVGMGEVASVVVTEVSGARVTADAASERFLDTRADCRSDSSRTAAVLSGLLVALMSIVALVVARFDPWIRV